MKIIEKKCPGCGADVKFDENATKGVCDYCKKEFIIQKDPQEEFLLSMNDFSKDVMHQVSSSFKFSRFLFFFIFFFAFSFIVGMIIFGFVGMHVNSHGYLKDVNSISAHDYSYIDSKATKAIDNLSFGDEEFHMTASPQRVQEYLLTKDKSNIYIPIYKTLYVSWPKQENKYIVYIPVKFNNVKTDSDGIDWFKLGEGTIDCEDYYFNLEHSSSSKGYQSIDDVYTKYIKALIKDGYVLSKK